MAYRTIDWHCVKWLLSPIGASIEKVRHMNNDSFSLKVWLGKVNVDIEPGFYDLWGHFIVPC